MVDVQRKTSISIHLSVNGLQLPGKTNLDNLSGLGYCVGVINNETKHMENYYQIMGICNGVAEVALLRHRELSKFIECKFIESEVAVGDVIELPEFLLVEENESDESDMEEYREIEARFNQGNPTPHHRVYFTGKFYGFKSATRGEEPAWFHTKAAARRFADACGWAGVEIETFWDPMPFDVMDTDELPWTKA